MGDTAFKQNSKANGTDDLIGLGDFLDGFQHWSNQVLMNGNIGLGNFLDGFQHWSNQVFMNGNILQDFLAKL